MQFWRYNNSKIKYFPFFKYAHAVDIKRIVHISFILTFPHVLFGKAINYRLITVPYNDNPVFKSRHKNYMFIILFIIFDVLKMNGFYYS